MTSTPAPQPTRLSPAIDSQLAALRRMIRTYVRADGTAAAIILLGAAFWCSLLLDWFFEPPAWARVVMLAAVVFGLLGVLLTRIVLRLCVPLENSSMALLLERRFARLDDTLMTAVELAGDLPAETEGFSSSMLNITCRKAEQRLARLPIDEVIHRGPLRRRLLIAAGLMLSIAMFAGLATEGFGVWARRSLLFADELWPRNTRLLIEGFDGGAMKVARGNDFTIVVMADREKPLVPKTVEVRYRTEGGSRRRAAMNREGDDARWDDAWQRYSHTFHGVLAPIEFEIRGGDASLTGLRLQVVESPTVEELSLSCEYPAYMKRPPRRLPVISTVTEIPYGTRVTVHGLSGKPLLRVMLDVTEGGRAKDRVTIEAVSDETGSDETGSDETGGAARHSFMHDLGAITEDHALAFNLLDTDGIKSRQPVPLVLAVAADEPPELPVSLRGIGMAVTPRARLPVEGRISDDHGIARLWFEFVIDEAAPGKVAIAEPQGNPTEIEVKPEETALEVRDLGTTAEQKLLVALKAVDRFDLADAPNEGSSQRWLLDVVTPARLQAILQARELLLRQRFEAIIEEVAQTRDSLVRIDFENKNGDDADGGEAAEERVLAVRSLRCERAVANCRKNAHEVLSAAEAFDDVLMQLINNRIDTEEMRARLRAGIVEPLKRIAEKMFPQLENRLLVLRDSIAEANTGPEKRDLAKTQIDAILLEMNEVLGRMMELEDYSQAIAILRSIIDSQQKLDEEVKQRHKAKLRKLLEAAGGEDAKPVAAAGARLSVKQQRIADKYKHLEEVLLRMAELSASADPRRTELLLKAVTQSKHRLIGVQFERLVELLDRQRLSRAMEGQTELNRDLKQLLKLLLSENRGKRIASEKAQIRRYLKQLNRIVRKQKALQGRALQGQTEGDGGLKRLAEGQGRLAQKTGRLSDQMKGDDKLGKPGDGEPSNGQSGEKSQNSSRAADNPAAERLRAARDKMKEAEEALKKAQREGAAQRQEEALRQLEKAKAELEKILRQLREEEMKRMLTTLQARFENMLKLQRAVYKGTLLLDKVPPAERMHEHEIAASRLGSKQSKIVLEADKALLLLKEDGTTVAFPEAVAQMREDMREAAGRLGRLLTGRITQGVEQDIMAALEEMIEALQNEIEKLEESQGQNPPPGAAQQDPALVAELAELKMIRALQMRVNRRTARYSKLVDGPEARGADLQEALRRLAQREARIHEVTRKLDLEKQRSQ